MENVNKAERIEFFNFFLDFLKFFLVSAVFKFFLFLVSKLGFSGQKIKKSKSVWEKVLKQVIKIININNNQYYNNKNSKSGYEKNHYQCMYH